MTVAPRILIAPACFKGSLSAPQVAAIIADFLQAHLPHAAVLDVCPVADGGDDTLAVLQAADSGFVWRHAQVTGPIAGRRVTASYLVHPGKKLVVIEAAQAHGLKLLPMDALAPMEATSFGVGELIRHAITAEQAETILVALGGSASTDGGTGALQALGVCFLDGQGKTIREPMNGRLLANVHRIEWLTGWSFAGQLLVATDVVNPLLGPDGTAAVFAPQKGAAPAQCQTLEANMAQLRPLMTKAVGMDYAALPGMGAAGGLAYGLRHLPRAGIVSGSQWVGEQLHLQEKIQQADVIITGEGRFDATSLGGKATGNILVWAGSRPVLLVCGQVDDSLAQFGPVTVYPLAQAGESTVAAMAEPQSALEHTLQRMLPDLLARISAL